MSVVRTYVHAIMHAIISIAIITMDIRNSILCMLLYPLLL